MATREAVAKALASLDVIFPRTGLSAQEVAARAELYCEVLADLTDADIAYAAREAARRERFFPPPVVLIDLAHPARDVEGKAEMMEQADRAWERLLEDCTYHGLNCRAKVSCDCTIEQLENPDGPSIRAVVGEAAYRGYLAAGGAGAFAKMEGRDEVFMRKAFVAAFLEVVAVRPEYALPPGQQRALTS